MQTAIMLLTEAKQEIVSLRRQNELMRARLDMFDNIMQMLHTQPAYKGEGMSPDLVYAIEKFITSELTPENGKSNDAG